jgi:hypothetical protein
MIYIGIMLVSMRYSEMLHAISFDFGMGIAFSGKITCWLVQFCVFACVFFFFFLLDDYRDSVPITPAKITDLDQMTALVLTGIFVLVFSIGDLINREWEQISAAYRVFLGTLEGFRGAFLFRNLERFYLALRLDVVVQCFRTRSCRRNVSANF